MAPLASKSLLATLALLTVVIVGGFAYLLFQGGSKSASCYTFTRTPQPGLFDTFHGKVCTNNSGVQSIAKNYNLCVKQTGSVPQCGYALLSYFASSGAYPEDAAKAELLVIQAATGT